jgi:hypothetical protein
MNEERRRNLIAARNILATLEGRQLERFPAAGPGVCADCELDVELRARFGKFDLCRICLARRLRVGHTRRRPEA